MEQCRPTAVRAVPESAGVRQGSFAVASRWLQPLRYWHLLSLDAPAVASVWMLAFCFGTGARYHVRQSCCTVFWRCGCCMWRTGCWMRARRWVYWKHDIAFMLVTRGRFVCAWACVASITAGAADVSFRASAVRVVVAVVAPAGVCAGCAHGQEPRPAEGMDRRCHVCAGHGVAGCAGGSASGCVVG